MKSLLLTLTISTLFLGACNLRYIPEGSQICPDRIWMMPETKAWLRHRIAEVTLENLPIRLYLSLVSRQQQQLDVCNGYDPGRPGPYKEK